MWEGFLNLVVLLTFIFGNNFDGLCTEGYWVSYGLMGCSLTSILTLSFKELEFELKIAVLPNYWDYVH